MRCPLFELPSIYSYLLKYFMVFNYEIIHSFMFFKVVESHLKFQYLVNLIKNAMNF